MAWCRGPGGDPAGVGGADRVVGALRGGLAGCLTARFTISNVCADGRSVDEECADRLGANAFWPTSDETRVCGRTPQDSGTVCQRPRCGMRTKLARSSPEAGP